MNSGCEWKKNEVHVVSLCGFRQFTIPSFVKKTISILSTGSKILDLGCGAGGEAFAFHALGMDVFAADLDCREVVRNCRRLHVEDIRIKECSFTDLPYENGVFDAVVSPSVLHHAAVSDIKKGFREIYRVLKPEGTFLFDFLSVFDESYGKGKKVEYNTFVGSRSGEESIPHHYADEKEIVRFTNQFHRVKIQKSVTVCFDSPEPYVSREFQVTAIK